MGLRNAKRMTLPKLAAWAEGCGRWHGTIAYFIKKDEIFAKRKLKLEMEGGRHELFVPHTYDVQFHM